MKILFTALLFLTSIFAFSATIKLDPTITPALFQANTSITITYDVTGTALASLSSAYIWVWIPGATSIDAKYNVTPASSNATLTNNAKFTKSVAGGKTIFSITFVPSSFFAQSITSATQLGVLLKGNDWPDGQTTDSVNPFWDGSFQVKLVSPASQPLFVDNGDVITIQAETPVTADYSLSVNGSTVDTQTGLTSYSFQLNASDAQPSSTVTLLAAANGKTSSVSFDYVISKPSPVAARPAGIIDGINYSADPTKVTLSLWAPQKTSVYVIGDFNNWKVSPTYEMNKDGEHFWLEVDGLTSGTEYGFQYLVEESLFVADPYADKVLDPDDSGIPATTYPNLKAFPAAAKHSEYYFNRVSILQTAQTPYAWKTATFQKPAKEKLVIYELLIRDFFGPDARNYQSLIDTIGYFKRLGVNAIELMPVTEFNGNDSWGYNPTFMFAPDKYYGTREKLKEFVDTCHKNGIAVILDIVMNQQDLPNPYVLMYYDFSIQKPTPNNPWFNVDATHPYSVFYDLNHESAYTKKYLDTVTYHWLNDYRVDGLRFDLAKGFTQTKNTDVGAWSAYDASRIAILKRMSDVIWSRTPEAYVILEHFADNTEETELANYRADEGKGMMLWENFNDTYSQNSMGFADRSDFSASYFTNKGWNKPREVSYMESHDEERLMFRNLSFGSSSGTYNVRVLTTALSRMKATSLLFYTVPGAKMLWEFGEVGYDLSINTCTDGITISNDCRVSAKPVLWSYETVTARKDLLDHTTDLIRLRNGFSVFTEGAATIDAATTSMVKQVTLKNSPFTDTPSDSTQMNVQVVANMDVASINASVKFSHTGTWYDYYAAGAAVTVVGSSQSILLAPGDFKIYTDVRITRPIVREITGVEFVQQPGVNAYPNPVSDILMIAAGSTRISEMSLTTMQGTRVTPQRVGDSAWDVRELAPGMYVAEVAAGKIVYRIKLVKK